MITKKLKSFVVSIQLGIVSGAITIVVGTCLIISLILFHQTKKVLHQNLQKRIAAILTTGAHLIDPEMHAKLKEVGQEASPDYLAIRHKMQQIRDSDSDIRFVYTLRQLEGTQYTFIVDAEESEKDRSPLGTTSEYKSPLLSEAFTTDKPVLVEENLESDKWGQWLSAYVPLRTADGKIDAVLGLDISAQTIAAYEHEYFKIVLSVAAFAMLIMATIGIYFSRKVSRPLIEIGNEMDRISQLNLENPLAIKSSIWEIIKISNSIENMKSALRSFQKYVPADLVAELIRLKKEARLGGEKKELSIFFSDIADFTTIAEQLSPEELSQRLSEYLEVITTEITNLGGTVDKYIGDAVMAFWGAPNELKNHAELAARAALACQAKIAELNQKWKTEGKTPFITRIGISTGAVIVGNFGYAKRLNYTVMGDSVNLASRLEGLNKFYGTDIVISPRTAELCGDRFVMRKIDSVAVKGKKEGVFIFELLSETSQAPDLRFAYLTRFNSALTHYFAQEWQKSEALLNEVLATHAEDGPSKVILKRCHEFAANPPGKDWTGIIFLREK